MQTGNLPVCSLALFDDALQHFWISDIKGLVENFPFLENPHKNTYYSILIIDQAKGQVVIDNDKIILDAAKIIILKPSCINSINIDNHASGKIICFTEDFFSLRYNSNVLRQFSFLNREAKVSFRLTRPRFQHIDTIIQLLQEEYDMHNSQTKKVIRSYLNIFLFELDRIYNPHPTVKSRNPSQEKIQEFERLVEKNFNTKKLPSSYAELLNISTNYLNKLCKKETGLTAGDIIRKHIIIEAQRLLHYTHYNINEIADKLGFDNTSYFVTIFKKHTQQTPEQFRKNQNL
ncbi:Bifunctional transcriptional activator/DNA repair enzyme AdaA [compost metagenome]